MSRDGRREAEDGDTIGQTIKAGNENQSTEITTSKTISINL